MMIDNTWVVPYNPYLLMLNDCHVMVDYVTSHKVCRRIHG
jgi:hypothetical protein